MTQSNNFCPLPFAHTAISPTGDFLVCCYHSPPTEHKKNISDHDLNDWWHGDYINQVRAAFRNNQKHPGCQSCWLQESRDVDSYRTQILKEYQILKANSNSTEIQTIEIQMGNVCNLGCLMCSPSWSSYINSENKKIKQLDTVISSDHLFDENKVQKTLQLINDLDIKIINVRGGETLYSKAIYRFLDAIDDHKKRKLVVHLSTNATMWNEKWKKLFLKFRLVRFMISVDATGDLYNYLRYPGDWNQTKKNILEITKMPNAKFLINCVVQNLNIMNLGGIIEFANHHSIHLTLELIQNPSYMEITNLPQEKLKVAIDRLSAIQELELKQKNILNQIEQFKQILSQSIKSERDQNLWEEFLGFINKKDQHRGKNFWDYLI